MPEGMDGADLGVDAGADEDISFEGETFEGDAPEFDSQDQPTESVADALFEIDGTPITLDEARSGYLRQADYTRKTQEIATLRRELQTMEAVQAALERNPAETLKALAEAYGVPLGQVTQSVAPDGEDNPWDEPTTSSLDPAIQEKLDRLDRFVAEQQQQQVIAQIESQLNELRDKFGEIDEHQLITHAMKRGFDDLRTAYADLNFDQLAALRQKQAESQQRLAAKKAAQVVSQGGSKGTASKQSATGTPVYSDIREAWAAAKEQLES